MRMKGSAGAPRGASVTGHRRIIRYPGDTT